jgi:hypothetical protein
MIRRAHRSADGWRNSGKLCRARRRGLKGKLMRKAARNDELRSEYDAALIRSGARGKYAKRYRAGTNLVWLAPDVAAAFPNSESVNEALRLLLKLRDSIR